MQRMILAILVTAGVLSAQSVLAAATFSFDCSKTDCSNPSSSAWGNTRAFTTTDASTGATITVTASAWANTGGTDPTNNGASQTLQTAYLGAYGTVGSSSGSNGLGACNRDGLSTGSDLDSNECTVPEHAMDNNQRYDVILLSFSSAVSMSQIKLGYANTDSDVSIWAYAGTGAPTLAGSTYAGLFTSGAPVTTGWAVIGNYADACSGLTPGAGNTSTTCNSVAVDSSNFVSSYWLVGAYNPGKTASSCSSTTVTGDVDCGDDYVKLLTTTVSSATSSSSSSAAPEPASLALVGLALAGIAVSRRRKE